MPAFGTVEKPVRANMRGIAADGKAGKTPVSSILAATLRPPVADIDGPDGAIAISGDGFTVADERRLDDGGISFYTFGDIRMVIAHIFANVILPDCLGPNSVTTGYSLMAVLNAPVPFVSWAFLLAPASESISQGANHKLNF